MKCFEVDEKYFHCGVTLLELSLDFLR